MCSQILISATALSKLISVEAAGPRSAMLDVVALRDDAGTVVNLRIVNPYENAQSVSYAFQACTFSGTSAQRMEVIIFTDVAACSVQLILRACPCSSADN